MGLLQHPGREPATLCWSLHVVCETRWALHMPHPHRRPLRHRLGGPVELLSSSLGAQATRGPGTTPPRDRRTPQTASSSRTPATLRNLVLPTWLTVPRAPPWPVHAHATNHHRPRSSRCHARRHATRTRLPCCSRTHTDWLLTPLWLPVAPQLHARLPVRVPRPDRSPALARASWPSPPAHLLAARLPETPFLSCDGLPHVLVPLPISAWAFHTSSTLQGRAVRSLHP